MTTKPKTIPASSNHGAVAAPAEHQADPKARAKTSGRLTAEGILPLAIIAQAYGKGLAGEEIDLIAMHEQIVTTGRAASDGKLGAAEQLLQAQALTLNAIFAELARRAAMNMGAHLDAAETYMRLALKAQAQSRATLQTLIEAKNPRAVTFMRQANVAQQQVVNNGTQPSSEPRARGREKAESRENELLQDRTHEQVTLDAGAPGQGRRSHPPVEAMGAVDGPTH